MAQVRGRRIPCPLEVREAEEKVDSDLNDQLRRQHHLPPPPTLSCAPTPPTPPGRLKPAGGAAEEIESTASPALSGHSHNHAAREVGVITTLGVGVPGQAGMTEVAPKRLLIDLGVIYLVEPVIVEIAAETREI